MSSAIIPSLQPVTRKGIINGRNSIIFLLINVHYNGVNDEMNKKTSYKGMFIKYIKLHCMKC